MTKYYRVLQDTFLWSKEAIIQSDDEGYRPIDDIWDATDVNGEEYISDRIIEAPENAKYFERVYPIGKLEKMVFGTKIQAQAAASALYRGDKADGKKS